MQVQSSENEFLVELQKLMASQVAATLWATNMDLLALITFDNLIQLYRISYKAQRVFQAEQTKAVKSLAFSPDSQLLAYGLSDGSVRLVKTENGQQILSLDGAHTGEVDSLTFVTYCSLQSTAFMPFQKNSLQSKLILNISPHKSCNRNAIVKINYFAQLRPEFTLLLSSQKSKTIFLLNGFIPYAELNYSQIGLSSPRVLYCHYDGRVRSIVAEQAGTKSRLWLVQSQAKALGQWRQALIKGSCLLGYISQALSFVESAYDAAEMIVREALRQYNSKINLIDDPNIQNLSPCEELFKFLNCGTTSTAVVNFFTKEVYDTKILEKLDETLNAAFAQLHDLLLESVQNGLERAALMLARLRDLAQGSQAEKLGVGVERLAAAEARLIKLYTMGEVLLVESTEAKFDVRNLLVWLNKSTIKSAGENEAEIENSKSYLNKYTVDFTRLHGFLSEDRKFKLQNLLAFFSKTNEAQLLTFQKADFDIMASGRDRRETPKQRETFDRLAVLFQVENEHVPSGDKMQIEQSYRSFKVEMKQLQGLWKELARQPVTKVSRQLWMGWRKTGMGEVEESELFPLQFRAMVLEGQLIAYFVEREMEQDRLVRFNCHTGERTSLVSTQNHILTIAISESVLAVLENKYTGQKMVAQVGNEAFDGGEIVIGKRMLKVEGELDINSSMRGLNSLVIDKNKLIIFD